MLQKYRKCQKIESFKNDWVKLRPKNCLLRLFENFLFTLFTSNDDSNFCQKCSCDSKSYFYQETNKRQSWKFIEVKFWPKPNMQNGAHPKAFILEH